MQWLLTRSWLSQKGTGLCRWLTSCWKPLCLPTLDHLHLWVTCGTASQTLVRLGARSGHVATVLLQAAELKNVMDGYPRWSPSWKLLPNTYECAHDFWGDLFRATFPHTKKLLDKEVRIHDSETFLPSHCSPCSTATCTSQEHHSQSL